jgi:hypothetical protein
MMSATIETLRPDHSAVAGYVDEVHKDRVFGWAWDRRSPGLRVEIEVWIGDTPVAAAIADRARADLKANGVGDGQHAFEIALPEATAQTVSQPIRIFAKAPDGELIELERRAPAAEPGPTDQSLPRLFNELAMLRGTQRELARAARAILGDLKRIAPSADAPAAAAADAAGIAEIMKGQATVLDRLNQIETFMMRLDGTVADLAQRVAAEAQRPASPGAQRWVWLAIAGGVAAIVGVYLVVGLSR